jgi:hypothetical protein
MDEGEEEGRCYEDLTGCFPEHGVDIADFEEAFDYIRKKSSNDISPIELVDADDASPLLPHWTTCSRRDRMARRMKLSMAMSLGSAYPAGAGGPLTQQEYRAHLACLFACIGIDLLLQEPHARGDRFACPQLLLEVRRKRRAGRGRVSGRRCCIHIGNQM